MSPVQLRGVTLGEGRTRVIVPITASTSEELVTQATTLAGVKPDIIEWRVDFLDAAPSPAAVLEAAAQIRTAARDRPVLFTFRSHHENGNKPIPPDEYHDLNIAAIASGLVDAVDVNERALALTRMNAERARVADRVRTFSPDDAVYDEIWSNPPIRIGKKALHELLLTWLPRLRPGGAAYLVVSKNLGADSLTTWLIQQGWPTEKLASAKGFRVLKVRRDSDSPA